MEILIPITLIIYIYNMYRDYVDVENVTNTNLIRKHEEERQASQLAKIRI